MTSPAIRQFIAIFGGDCVAKGAQYEEPFHGEPSHIAFIMGQCDYIIGYLSFKRPDTITCPFVFDTLDAARWAAGKYRERKDERDVVEAYARAGRLA